MILNSTLPTLPHKSYAAKPSVKIAYTAQLPLLQMAVTPSASRKESDARELGVCSMTEDFHSLAESLALHPADEDHHPHEDEAKDDRCLAGVDIALRPVVAWSRRLDDNTIHTWNVVVLEVHLLELSITVGQEISGCGLEFLGNGKAFLDNDISLCIFCLVVLLEGCGNLLHLHIRRDQSLPEVLRVLCCNICWLCHSHSARDEAKECSCSHFKAERSKITRSKC